MWLTFHVRIEEYEQILWGRKAVVFFKWPFSVIPLSRTYLTQDEAHGGERLIHTMRLATEARFTTPDLRVFLMRNEF